LIEIRIHGRGGQGAVLAAELLVHAAFAEGKFGQAFPAFGGERRGAPVQAFVRLDKSPVRVRYRVYRPDYVVILDRTLPDMIDVLDGLRPDGVVLIDSARPPATLSWSADAPVYAIPATAIAMEVFGQPLVNPAMLGALAAITSEISLLSIQDAFQRRFPGSLGEKNGLAAQMGYDHVLKPDVLPVRVTRSPHVRGVGQASAPDAGLGAPGHPLHFGLVVAPRTSLAYPTGGWRYARPAVDADICNGCGLCVAFCPDSSLTIVEKQAIVDYMYCKGCGICSKVCSRGAIAMMSEEG
jgi:pyruvate ferredoxin oxidoreductase gamma subunit